MIFHVRLKLFDIYIFILIYKNIILIDELLVSVNNLTIILRWGYTTKASLFCSKQPIVLVSCLLNSFPFLDILSEYLNCLLYFLRRSPYKLYCHHKSD